ncbi:MAG TPA: hypothetical protein VIK89_12060 [Cytophagaceae bacterium]
MYRLLILIILFISITPFTGNAQYEKIVKSDSSRVFTTEEKEFINNLSKSWQGPIPGRKNLYEVITFDQNKNFETKIYKSGNQDKLISTRQGKYYLLYNNFIVLYYQTENYYRTAKVRRLTDNNLQLNIQMDCSGELRLKLKKI